MAETGQKISALQAATSAADADVLAGVQNTATKKFSFSVILNYIKSKLTPADIGAVPNTRTVNNKALSADIALTAADVGAATSADIPAAYATNPEMDGTASAGSSTAWARGDHVHPSDTSKADIDGTYENLTAGQLLSIASVGDKVPYIFRPSGGMAGIGNQEKDTLVGGTIVWNQIVDTSDTSVTIPNGHIYAASLSGTFSVGESDGTALTVDGSGGDMVFDLTRMFGAAVTAALYAVEAATPGAGAAWFRAQFPKSYYAYNAGELLSVNASAHKTVGFNQWDEEWEIGSLNNDTGLPVTDNSNIRAKNFSPCIPSTAYFFSGDSRQRGIRYFFYDSAKTFISGNITSNSGSVVTSPANAAYFKVRTTNSYGNTYNHDICVNLSSSRNGEYEVHVQHNYPLDSDLTLRGIPKVDADGKLYYDGDAYEADGTVTRRHAERAYEAGDESLPDAITDGTTTVYKLTTTTTETADPFTSPQVVDEWGTEEYVVTEQSGVAVPVGHDTFYSKDLRGKLEAMPDSVPSTASIAPTENGDTASQAYAQGKYFFRGGNFCKALTSISAGASFTLNTNYAVTTVAAELYTALH